MVEGQGSWLGASDGHPEKALKRLVISDFNAIYPWYLLSLAAGTRVQTSR